MFFNGKPDSFILYKMIVVDYLNGLDPKIEANNYLYFLVSKNDPSKLIFDTGCDRNFANEKTYDQAKNNNYIKIKNVEFRTGNLGQKTVLYIRPVYSEIIINGNFRKKLGIQAIPIYRIGKFKAKDAHKYKVAVFNNFQNEYTTQNTSLIISPEESNFPSGKTYPLSYRIGDTIYLNNLVYVFKKVNKDGDAIELDFLKVMKQNFGLTVGKYAFKMKFNDLFNGRTYEIGSSKKFTLLDFWGTWCTPCIELTSELKRLHHLFNPDKFEIVSIAYDNSIENVQKYLQKEGINWTNIYDDRKNSMIASKFKVNDFPTFILLNENGKIIKREVGKNGLKNIESFLVSHIKN